ncbi:hypothetical protein ACFL4G_12640 [Thermodesulfobacteriota bacterium]
MKESHVLAGLLIVAMAMVGCQGDQLDGVYRYEEFAKIETGAEFYTGTLEFAGNNYALEQVASIVEEGTYAAGEGSLDLNKENKAIYPPDQTLVIAPSLLAQPGNKGIAWAVKERSDAWVDGCFETIVLEIDKDWLWEEVGILFGAICFDSGSSTCDIGHGDENGDQYMTQTTYELFDDGTISWEDDAIGVTFSGMVGHSNGYFFSRGETGIVGASSRHYVMFAAMAGGGSHDLAGVYNLLKFGVNRAGGMAVLEDGTLEIDELDGYMLELDTSENPYVGVINRSSSASFDFMLDDNPEWKAIMANEDNSVMVMANLGSPSEEVDFIFATRMPGQD